MSKNFTTADLYDAHGDRVRVVSPALLDYGDRRAFSGQIATIRCCEDNSMVRAALSEPGLERVLVVDGEGSRYCALLGDNLAAMAVDNGWKGIVIWGCVRDAAALSEMPLGIKALATNPRRSDKQGRGERDVTVSFLGTPLCAGRIPVRRYRWDPRQRDRSVRIKGYIYRELYT